MLGRILGWLRRWRWLDLQLDWRRRRRGVREDLSSARSEQFLTNVLPAEIEAINKRRREAEPWRPDIDAETTGNGVIEAVGLALSGGGVRSAAFCLGVLQAMGQKDLFRRIDYLSTVSGGGYIGSSLSATLTQAGGDFVFTRSQASGDPSEPTASEIKDTDEVEHIRNYSNYLILGGFPDIITSVALVLRGLVANLGLVLPVILIGAAITIYANPTVQSLSEPSFWGAEPPSYVPDRNFGFTIVLAVFALPAFFGWALLRSFRKPSALPEYRRGLPRIGASIVVLLAIVLFFEFQPFMIDAMFRAAEENGSNPQSSGGLISDVVANWVQWLAALTAPVAAIVAFFAKRLGDTISAGESGSKRSALMAAIAARGVVLVAAAALPLVIWVGYLYLSYWGIPDETKAPPAVEAVNHEPDWYSHRPGWLTGAVGIVDAWVPDNAPADAEQPTGDVADTEKKPPYPWDVIILYAGSGALILLIALFLKPNANSLHRLYRDRLSKAFLFNPKKPAEGKEPPPPELEPLDIKISELANVDTPYHLINAALNVQNSDFANRRGRNADFFMFSPHFIGSEATGYVQTKLYESDPPDLDLGTALAISGAAFSSNMGSKSIRVLAPTLALLNVRLGYWLKSPGFMRFVRNRPARSAAEMEVRSRPESQGKSEAELEPLIEAVYRANKKNTGGRFSATKRPAESRDPRLAPLYLLREMFGRLHENGQVVYVTDGGHIENLGVYELLRRRCRLIIAVDAEADPDLTFPSFVTLQRYARIDLGVRLSRMPWQEIQTTTKAWMGAGSPAKAVSEPHRPSEGPHVAVGEIDYGLGEDNKGYIVYVKSSLTGDENDYIKDYARRHPKYPHETTGDQFFSEEQFEVYRALGFHAMHEFLDDRDKAVVAKALFARGGPDRPPKRVTIKDPSLSKISEMLGV